MMRTLAVLLALASILASAACFDGAAESADGSATATSANGSEDTSGMDDEDPSRNGSGVSYIILGGTSITLNGGGAVVDGSQVAITSAGTYSISGTLDDGQIVVDADDEAEVAIILNGVDVACSTNAPIYVKNAGTTVITLADGTDNLVTDGDSYLVEDSLIEDSQSIEPNAAVFSKDDLVINGGGSLTVDANYNNGIQSKDDLEITGGDITVNAMNDGIKGRDSIVVNGASVRVEAGGDGMQSDNDADSERGYVSIEGGTLDIVAGADGIQAETSLTVSGGDTTISSGGGSVNGEAHVGEGGDTWGDRQSPGEQAETDSADSSASAKGLKSGTDITIVAGAINIDSSDDAIHSNDTLTIKGGSILLASGDDGIHSDSSVEIDGGDVSIATCYEGIESAAITINDGSIHLVSSDDGMNAVSADGGSAMEGWPGQDGLVPSGDNYLDIHGGYVAIDAAGDGLDINGPINMTGGIVIINGPTRNDNGALDYFGTFEVTGGLLVAVGSSGMAEAPSTSSSQYAVMVNLSSAQPASTMIHIESGDSEEVLSFVATKAYQSVVLCSPDLENGSTYVVYTGGSSTGTVTDGLYSGGAYSPGTQVASLSISSIVTTVGSSGGAFPGGMPGGPPR